MKRFFVLFVKIGFEFRICHVLYREEATKFRKFVRKIIFGTSVMNLILKNHEGTEDLYEKVTH